MANNVYQSEYTGQQMDSKFSAVAALQEAVAALETAVAAKYTKPGNGIPATDLDADVQAALALALTAVQSLADYYTKAQVDAIAAAIAAAVNSTSGVTVTTLPSASADTLGKIYYVGPDGNGEYARKVTSYDGTTYSWLDLGTTAIDLTQYATKEELSQLDQKVDVQTGVTTVADLTGETTLYYSIYTAVEVGATVNVTPVTNGSYQYIIIPVAKGDKVYVKGSGGSDSRLWAFTDGSYKLISKSDASVTASDFIELTATADGYCILNLKTSVSYPTGIKHQYLTLLKDYLDDVFDDYSAGLFHKIDIVGVGTTGSGAGVKKVGDIFYNTSTGLLRQAVSPSGSSFTYKTVPPDYNALYMSPTAMYRFVSNVFTQQQISGLGWLLGGIFQNASDIAALRGRHFKICLLGNSYAADCWRYVPLMLLAYGVTCEIYFYYRGSGSLNDLNSQWTDYGQSGLAESDGLEHVRFCAHIDTRKERVWVQYPTQTVDEETVNTMCALDIVEIGNTIGGWDLVVLQQVSVYTDVDPDNDTDGRYAHLSDIISYIEEHCDQPFGLAWFQSYTRASHDSATIRENSLVNQKKVFEQYPFTCEIPVATAVFSARGNETLAALGDSTYHNLWASDDVHLQDGLPCYIGALTVIQSLFKYFGGGKSVLNDAFRATSTNVTGIGLELTAQYPCVGVTDANCALAQRAAVQAVKLPSALSVI